MNPLMLSGILDIGSRVIDKLWPDPAKAAAAKLELYKLQQSGELATMASETNLALAQIAVNAEEAKSSSLFVAGWRPGAGWVCVVALAYAAIIEPLARFVATLTGYAGVFPAISTDITMQIMLGMLGLAGARTFEKTRNEAAK